MSIAYNNSATDMILNVFQGVAFRIDGIDVIYALV